MMFCLSQCRVRLPQVCSLVRQKNIICSTLLFRYDLTRTSCNLCFQIFNLALQPCLLLLPLLYLWIRRLSLNRPISLRTILVCPKLNRPRKLILLNRRRFSPQWRPFNLIHCARRAFTRRREQYPATWTLLLFKSSVRRSRWQFWLFLCCCFCVHWERIVFTEHKCTRLLSSSDVARRCALW